MFFSSMQQARLEFSILFGAEPFHSPLLCGVYSVATSARPVSTNNFSSLPADLFQMCGMPVGEKSYFCLKTHKIKLFWKKKKA